MVHRHGFSKGLLSEIPSLSALFSADGAGPVSADVGGSGVRRDVLGEAPNLHQTVSTQILIHPDFLPRRRRGAEKTATNGTNEHEKSRQISSFVHIRAIRGFSSPRLRGKRSMRIKTCLDTIGCASGLRVESARTNTC